MIRSFPATNAPTNAPPTLPTPLPTILPTHLPTGTNATANACSPTPHTPRALEAPNAAGARLGVPAAQGREGRKAARYRHARRNAASGAAWPCIIRSVDRARNGLRSSWGRGRSLPGRFPLPLHVLQSDRKQLIALLDPYRRPICPNHVASGGEGISRAGANSVFHSVEADQARASRPTSGEAAELADMRGLSHKIRPGGGGWGGKSAPCWISTSRPNFAAASKKSGGVSPQTSSTTAAVCRDE